MSVKRNQKLIVLALTIFLLSLSVSARTFQPKGGSAGDDPSTPNTQAGTPSTGTLLRWNHIAIDASGLDHTPVAVGENRVFGEQLGPCRAARAMAIVHIAMFDTINAVVGKYTSYTDVRRPMGPISLQAAVSQAAHDTLVALFPSQTAAFAARPAEDLADCKSRGAKRRSTNLGKHAAAAILELRVGDGSEHPESFLGTNENDYATSDLAGQWRQDPISLLPIALGAHWHECKPFVM